MTFSSRLALAAATLALAGPVYAQRLPVGGGSTNTQAPKDVKPQATTQETTVKRTGPTTTTGRQLNISPQAEKAILELQAAVNANDTANIPAKLEAARTVAQSADEKYVVASNQTQAALKTGDLAAIRTGIEAMQASGAAETADLVSLWSDLGKRANDAKQLDLASSALEKSLALDASHVVSLKLLALTRQAQGRNSATVNLLQRAFVATKAAGGKVPEKEYMFAAGLAHSNKLPAANAIGRMWVADYPSPTSWHDSLRIYRDIANPTGDALIDNMRLAHVTNGITSESEYHAFASALVAKGQLAEAKAVLDAGAAKKAFDPGKEAFKQLRSKLTNIPNRAAVDASAKTALSGGSAKAAINAGDAYYGVGAYSEAAAAYKAALGKNGVDANLANLRLGIALARAGDKLGAKAALNAVSGAQAETARYWLTWLDTSA